MNPLTIQKFWLWLILWLYVPLSAGATDPLTVSRVQVEGTGRISEDRVLRWLVTRPGMGLDSTLVQHDVQRILAGYRDEGFWQAAVSRPEIGARGGVVFRVEEGGLTRIDSVQVTGNQRMRMGLVLEVLDVRAGMPLIQRRLEAGLEALLRFYEERGYPYCALYPDVDIQPASGQVRVQIEEGPYVRIDTVRFLGNRVTRGDILLKEMRISQGEPYDQRRVDRALQALRRLPFLEGVEGSKLVRTGNRTALVVKVREARSARVEGGLGYAPGPGGAGQGITGRFALDFDNFQGTGRQGHVRWSRQGPEAADLSLRYREPWILGYPVFSDLHMEIQQRPGYSENRLGGHLGLKLTSELDVRAGWRFSGVRPDSSGFGRFLKNRMWGLEAGVRYDTRDDRWNPSSGVLYEGTVILGRVLQGRESRGRRRYNLDLVHFMPAGRRSLFALGLHGARVSQAGGVFYEALLRLGGTQTLRGYREEHFLATRAAWTTLEWRFLMGRRSRTFVFVDLGYLADPAGDALFPIGYGAGLRMTSRLGWMGVDYGLARGDSPGQGKVHIQMVNEF